jgi:hypothetical protein
MEGERIFPESWLSITVLTPSFIIYLRVELAEFSLHGSKESIMTPTYDYPDGNYPETLLMTLESLSWRCELWSRSTSGEMIHEPILFTDCTGGTAPGLSGSNAGTEMGRPSRSVSPPRSLCHLPLLRTSCVAREDTSSEQL